MLGDLMNKLQDAQQQMEETKKKLDSVIVKTEVENGLIKIESTANRRITNLLISDDLLEDKEALEDLLIVAVNKVLTEADKTQEKEMGGIAQGMAPGLSGLFG